MKKLITAAVASAFAFLAIGAINAVGLPSGTSVEAYTGALRTNMNDDGDEESSRFWFLAGDEGAELLVTNYESGVTLPPRPEQFAEETNNNFLKIDTTGRLYRSIGVNSQTVDSFPSADIGDGLYLDTMVKFTAAESAFEESDIAAGDKLAISYVEHGEDALDPKNPDDFTFTNIVVRAGYVDGSTITPKNYRLNLPEDFVSTNWHRLTVRAISDVGYANAPVAFAVYVDTNLLTYATSEQAGTSAYETALAGNATVATYLYNSEKHALLPSLVNSGAVKDTLSAVGFKGNGCIDDVSFTASKPSFIVENTMVTIAWEAGVTNYSVIANGSTPITNENVSADGEVLLTLDPSITTLTVEAQYDATHKPGKWIASNGAENLDGNVWTIEKDGKLTITSIVPKFQVGDKFFDSFDDAVSEAVDASTTTGEPATIKLLDDYDEGDLSFIEGDIILDLAGYTLTGTETATILNAGANLIITNSTVTVGHIQTAVNVVDSEADVFAILIGGGVTKIYGGSIDGLVEFDAGEAELTDLLELYGGVYVDVNGATDPANFYLNVYAEDTVTYTGSDSYFQVGTAAPQPTTYELRIPAVTGASATVTDKATSSVIADLTAIEDGTVVTVTWEADDGYKITAGATEEITMDDNQTATAPTVVAITYATLTITPVANCTIIVSNATAEVATGATFDVDDAVELTVYRTPAEGYELDNCAATETITMDQDQTVTAAVKQSGGSYPSYIDGEDTEAQGKYDTWKSYVEGASETVGDGEALEEAYLLNCKPSEVAAAKAAFKFTSISYDSTQSKWVTPTTTSYNNRDYNGEVVVKQYSDVGCTTESSTGTFFKAVLQ